MLLIHCPACRAPLHVETSSLSRARRIRCGICAHIWLEAAYVSPAPAPAIEPEAQPEPAPADQIPETPPAIAEDVPPAERAARAQPPKRERRRRATQLSHTDHTQAGSASGVIWLSLAAGLVLLIASALAARETIVRQVPWLARPYAALGLPVNIHGLEFRDVRSRIFAEAAQKVLTIDGQISNLRAETQSLPDLHLSLRDANGREVYVWSAPPPKAVLLRGETIQFRARLAAPPEAAQAVRVQFSESTRTLLQ